MRVLMNCAEPYLFIKTPQVWIKIPRDYLKILEDCLFCVYLRVPVPENSCGPNRLTQMGA